MNGIKALSVIFLVGLGGATPLYAQSSSTTSPASIIQLQRDSSYELNLKYLASPDNAITPARVLRWISSLRGHTPTDSPSNIEFQPVLRVHDSQKQIIAQLAYKF